MFCLVSPASEVMFIYSNTLVLFQMCLFDGGFLFFSSNREYRYEGLNWLGFPLQELYPSSSFWSTYHSQKLKTASPSVDEPLSSKDDDLHLQLECDNGVHGTVSLQCQEVDGVVLGSWDYVAAPEVLENSGGEQANASAGYLVLATVWLHPWDEGTVDRVSSSTSLLQFSQILGH